MDSELRIQWEVRDNGRVVLKATLGDQPPFVNLIDIADAAEREAFGQALCCRWRGVSPDLVRQELDRIAGEVATKVARKSQASLLVELAADLDLFHTPGADAEGYAVAQFPTRRETLPIRSRAFRQWLRNRFWRVYEKAPGGQAVTSAIETIAAKATLQGEEHPVYVRIAQLGAATYLDLADREGRVVEMSADGWRILAEAPVRFVRPKGLQALPEPERGGSLDDLRDLVNVADKDSWVLLLAWLRGALRPVGPYPVLVINGEQGSAKSTLTRLIKLLLDPSATDVRAEPRDVRDLMIAAQNSHILALDNLSTVPAWLSDALCRLSTGGGLSTRQLYTDDEEKLFEAKRPVVLNGIEDFVGRADLLDRCVTITLQPIPPSDRKPESSLRPTFNIVRPSILGALLDAYTAALRALPYVNVNELPRMADFALFAIAGEQACGLASGSFMAAYQGNREAANSQAIEASAIGAPLLALLSAQESWNGTFKDLLAELNSDRCSDEAARRRKDWPQNPKKLSGDLRRLAPNLRHAGVDVRVLPHTNRGRVVTISRGGARPSQPSPNPPFVTNPAGGDHGGGSEVTVGPPADPVEPSPNGDGFGGLWLSGDGRDDREGRLHL